MRLAWSVSSGDGEDCYDDEANDADCFDDGGGGEYRAGDCVR